MKKLDKTGSHTRMSDEEIDDWYQVLENEHEEYLSKYNVHLPNRDTAKALWLVFLRKYKRTLVHKDTISEFVRSVKPNAGRDQQVRHIASDGWFVLNAGENIPDTDKTVERGYHALITTERPKPSFQLERLKRAGRIAASNFKQLKATYGNRCATCGSEEGKPHLLDSDKETKLQKAHMNPHKALELDNIIPQCQVCNQTYQDNYSFDKKGRVTGISSLQPVKKAPEHVKQKIKEFLC